MGIQPSYLWELRSAKAGCQANTATLDVAKVGKFMGYWEGALYAKGMKGAGRSPLHHSRQRPTIALPSPYQRPTWAASSSDFVTKSEDEAAQVGRW